MPVTTVTASRCKCGATIVADAADGLCSACLFAAALAPASPDEPGSGGANVLMDFGDYELLEELGRGGQGVVYRARQKGLNRIVALKIIGLGHWASERHLRRFRMEAEAAAQLDHPGIVPIYEIAERDGACYFSMKYIEGAALGDRAIPVRRAAELMVKVARTVHYAHEHGVLHRDIKPGNILLGKDGEPHLTDFGLARLLEKGSNVTRTLDVLGTPSYMAPEQANGHHADATRAVDVYGLGAVFYHLLTGQPPFAGGTTYETLKLVLENEPRSPRLWNRKVDRDVETICLKCLEKTPQRRYPTALAFAEDLERWLRHEPIRARRVNIISRAGKWLRRNGTLSAAAALVLVLGSLLASVVWRNAAERPPPAGIAVLPFDNLSDSKEDALLADAIQDDVLNKLAKVADLKVISRTSVMAYRGEQNIRKIGGALRVSHVLEGSVHRVDGRVRLNAQLIDARTDTHVWAETYERSRADLFALESELAQQVATRLAGKLSPAEKNAIEARPTKDLEAYDLYVRANDIMSKVSIVMDVDATTRLDEATTLLESAVARDPQFSLAWSKLSEAYLWVYWTSLKPLKPIQWRDRAEAALKRATALAPDAGETHLARGLLFYWGYKDYDRALEELEVAGRVLPNNAQVFQVTSWVERRLDRWKDSLRHALRAAELNPRDAVERESLIRDHSILRRYRDAVRIADQAVADFPQNENLKVARAEALLAAGNLGETRAAIETLSTSPPIADAKFQVRFTLLLYERKYDEADRYLSDFYKLVQSSLPMPGDCLAGMIAHARNDTQAVRARFASCRDHLQAQLQEQPEIWAWLSMLGQAEAALGEEEAALRDAARAWALPDHIERQEIILRLPMVYCWLGKKGRALDELEKAVKSEIGVSYGDLKFNPAWDSLRDDPRFQQILEEAAKPLPL